MIASAGTLDFERVFVSMQVKLENPLNPPAPGASFTSVKQNNRGKNILTLDVFKARNSRGVDISEFIIMKSCIRNMDTTKWVRVLAYVFVFWVMVPVFPLVLDALF